MRRVIGSASLLLALLGGCARDAAAQPALERRLAGLVSRQRLAGPVDGRVRVRLPGTVHPLAREEYDVGPVAPDRLLSSMILVLRKEPAQETELTAFLAEQQDPRSPLYHQWLTPDSFGEHFGLAARDLEMTADWLREQGFTIDEVSAGKGSLFFSGTAARAQAAFGVELRSFQVDGVSYYGNVTDVQIPQDLAPVVTGVVGLQDFNREAGRRPVPRSPLAGGGHAITPSDFATIYGLNAVYASGITGVGQTIAVVGRCNIDLAVPGAFRGMAGLPALSQSERQVDKTIAACDDDELLEAYLDVEWAGAAAKNAQVLFAAASTVDRAANNVVQNDLAPVMSTSFGLCETKLGTASNYFWNALWQQAASQGITSLVASGDSGAAGCEMSAAAPPARSGLGVNGLCSSPYSVCVGGTQFNDTAAPGLYWDSLGAAKGYIPEVAWNESAPVYASSPGLWASGGGFSTVYARPDWQTSLNAGRGVPDVAVTAAGHDGYRICISKSCTADSSTVVLGTSAATPAFAGIMALVVEKTGQRQGNANPTLYALAARNDFGPIFHDVISGLNSVPGQNGYAAGVGWDAITGLGSVNGNALVTHWSSAYAERAVFSNQRITTTPPPATGAACTVPSGSSYFSAAVDQLYVYFNATVSSGDVLTANFLAPDGSVVGAHAWTPGSGNFCYCSGLVLSDRAANGTAAGNWSARVYDNGSQVFSLSFTVAWLSSGTPLITTVANAEGESPVIAPNMWMEIKGINLAPAGDARVWADADFGNNRMPTSLDGVSVTVNGKSAYVYYVSPTQVNVLTPPDALPGLVQVQVIDNGYSGSGATVSAQALSPSFFIIGAGPYVVGEHLDWSLLGPTSLYPGQTTPARPGETIVLFANGFGSTTVPVVSGAMAQSGQLSPLPMVKIGGLTAQVSYAALIAPGLYQFNVVVPAGLPNGDNTLSATIGGVASTAGVKLTIQN